MSELLTTFELYSKLMNNVCLDFFLNKTCFNSNNKSSMKNLSIFLVLKVFVQSIIPCIYCIPCTHYRYPSHLINYSFKWKQSTTDVTSKLQLRCLPKNITSNVIGYAFCYYKIGKACLRNVYIKKGQFFTFRS